MSWIKSTLYYGVMFLMTLALVEVSSYVLTINGFLLVNDIPGRYLKASKATTATHYSWRTEREDWGAWHLPSVSTIHSTSCFSVW